MDHLQVEIKLFWREILLEKGRTLGSVILQVKNKLFYREIPLEKGRTLGLQIFTS